MKSNLSKILSLLFSIQKKTTHLCSFSGIFISSSNKKRPHNLVFGRVYNDQILDYFEANILSFEGDIRQSMKYLDLGTLPTLICLGDVFETNPEMGRIRNYFTDLFSPFRNETIFMNVDFGMQLVVTLIGFEDKTLLFTFARFDPNSSSMVDLGVKLTVKIDRTKLAEDDKFKEACKQMKLEVKKNKKTVEVDALGETQGRVFVRQQDLKTLKLRKIKKVTGKTGKDGNKEKRIKKEADKKTKKSQNGVSEKRKEE